MGHAEGYILPIDTILDKIQETLSLGGTGILMQGGLHPDLKIEWYEDLLSGIKERFRDPLPLLPSAPRRFSTSPTSAAFRCATRLPGYAMPASIRFPAAAPRSWMTTFATASAA